MRIRVWNYALLYTLTPQFSEIGPFKLTENCENENYELCSNWAGKNRKLRGLLGCLDRKLREMSMIWNTENCENENYGGENCGVTVYRNLYNKSKNTPEILLKLFKRRSLKSISCL